MEAPKHHQRDETKPDKEASDGSHIAMVFMLFVSLSLIGFASLIVMAANEEGTGSDGYMGVISLNVWKTLYFHIVLLLEYYAYNDIQFWCLAVIFQIAHASMVYYVFLKIRDAFFSGRNRS